MKRGAMKQIITLFLSTILGGSLFAQSTKTIILNPPDTNKGLPVMKALSLRASAREFDTTELKLRDLSNLLWAANGVNRPEIGKRTAPSAQNAQDVDIYVFMKSGVYLYNANKHTSELVSEGDHRNLFSGRQENAPLPPVICLLVSDIARFKSGEDALRLVWGAMDAGIVTQNISVFCAAFGLATRPRAGGMNQPKLREILRLKDSQLLMLNHPVSYKKD